MVTGLALFALRAAFGEAPRGTPDEALGYRIGSVVAGGFAGLFVWLLWARRWVAAGAMAAAYAVILGVVLLGGRDGHADGSAFLRGCRESCAEAWTRGAATPGSPAYGTSPDRIRGLCDCYCGEMYRRLPEQTLAGLAREDPSEPARRRALEAEAARLIPAVSAACFPRAPPE